MALTFCWRNTMHQYKAPTRVLCGLACSLIVGLSFGCGPDSEDEVENNDTTNNGEVTTNHGDVIANCDDAPSITNDDINGGKTLAADGCYRVTSALTVSSGTLVL